MTEPEPLDASRLVHVLHLAATDRLMLEGTDDSEALTFACWNGYLDVKGEPLGAITEEGRAFLAKVGPCYGYRPPASTTSEP